MIGRVGGSSSGAPACDSAGRGECLEALERDVSSEFTRLSTVVHLHGGGAEGVGEDVVYDGLDHIAFQDAGPVLDIAGSYTLEEAVTELAAGRVHVVRLSPAAAKPRANAA